jgi:hypothetical protein
VRCPLAIGVISPVPSAYAGDGKGQEQIARRALQGDTSRGLEATRARDSSTTKAKRSIDENPYAVVGMYIALLASLRSK